ncbi:MAG: hypothetical protein GYB68_05485 [Chloroflexi bacterium]|nr:hypothetical protein [Chloroflexota bacterium]
MITPTMAWVGICVGIGALILGPLTMYMLMAQNLRQRLQTGLKAASDLTGLTTSPTGLEGVYRSRQISVEVPTPPRSLNVDVSVSNPQAWTFQLFDVVNASETDAQPVLGRFCVESDPPDIAAELIRGYNLLERLERQSELIVGLEGTQLRCALAIDQEFSGRSLVSFLDILADLADAIEREASQ